MHVGSKEWLEKFQEAVNLDPELNVIGKYCNTDFLLQIGPKEYIIQIQQGKWINFFERVRQMAIRHSRQSGSMEKIYEANTSSHVP